MGNIPSFSNLSSDEHIIFQDDSYESITISDEQYNEKFFDKFGVSNNNLVLQFYDDFYEELNKVGDNKTLRIYFYNHNPKNIIYETSDIFLYFKRSIQILKSRKHKVCAYVEESLNPLLSMLALACDEIYMKSDARLSNLHIENYFPFEKVSKLGINDLSKIINHFISINNETKNFIKYVLNDKFSNQLKNKIIEGMFDNEIELDALALLSSQPNNQDESTFSIEDLRKFEISIKCY